MGGADGGATLFDGGGGAGISGERCGAARVVDERAGGRADWSLGSPGKLDGSAQAGVGDSERVKLRVGAGDGFGEDGDAKAARGELGEDVWAAGLEVDARVESRGGAGGVKAGALAGALGQANECALLKRFEGDGRACGQWIVVEDSRDKWLINYHEGRYSRWWHGGKSHQCHVELPALQCLDQMVGVGL